jgi:hypothetical protein
LTRIPGQSKQSGFMGNVVELLMLKEMLHRIQSSEYWRDMDIDTLSVLTKTIDANGDI